MKPIGPTVKGSVTCTECLELYWEGAIHTCPVGVRTARKPTADEQAGCRDDDDE